MKTRTQDCVHISAEFVADLDTRGGTQITAFFLVNRIIARATNLCMHSIIENNSRITPPTNRRRGHRFVRVEKVRAHMTRVIVVHAIISSSIYPGVGAQVVHVKVHDKSSLQCKRFVAFGVCISVRIINNESCASVSATITHVVHDANNLHFRKTLQVATCVVSIRLRASSTVLEISMRATINCTSITMTK